MYLIVTARGKIEIIIYCERFAEFALTKCYLNEHYFNSCGENKTFNSDFYTKRNDALWLLWSNSTNKILYMNIQPLI